MEIGSQIRTKYEPTKRQKIIRHFEQRRRDAVEDETMRGADDNDADFSHSELKREEYNSFRYTTYRIIPNKRPPLTSAPPPF